MVKRWIEVFVVTALQAVTYPAVLARLGWYVELWLLQFRWASRALSGMCLSASHGFYYPRIRPITVLICQPRSSIHRGHSRIDGGLEVVERGRNVGIFSAGFSQKSRSCLERSFSLAFSLLTTSYRCPFSAAFSPPGVPTICARG